MKARSWAGQIGKRQLAAAAASGSRLAWRRGSRSRRRGSRLKQLGSHSGTLSLSSRSLSLSVTAVTATGRHRLSPSRTLARGARLWVSKLSFLFFFFSFFSFGFCFGFCFLRWFWAAEAEIFSLLLFYFFFFGCGLTWVMALWALLCSELAG